MARNSRRWGRGLPQQCWFNGLVYRDLLSLKTVTVEGEVVVVR